MVKFSINAFLPTGVISKVCALPYARVVAGALASFQRSTGGFGLPGVGIAIFAGVIKDHYNRPKRVLNSAIWLLVTLITIPIGILAYVGEVFFELLSLLTGFKGPDAAMREWKFVAVKNAQRAKKGESPWILYSFVWLAFVLFWIPASFALFVIGMLLRMVESLFGIRNGISQKLLKYENQPSVFASRAARGKAVF